MTKKNKLPLFIALVLLLAATISYISFNSATKEKTEKADFKMDVAVVNLDESVNYNGKEYNFGDEFKKSLENNDNHRFHIVDAAEADSGIADKRYNMAITIPNDFTKKALSIDDVSPEPINLFYKLNESDNEITKAQAQKISGDLLNTFNQKVIDVFFASVIGNLQSAQKNLSNIVKKQDQLAANYASNIYEPLYDYSSNLKKVNDSTSYTKDTFSGLNKDLNNFSKDAQSSLEGATSVDHTMKMMQEYLSAGNDSFNNLLSIIDENSTAVDANNAEETIQMMKDQQLLLSKKLDEDTTLLTTEIQTNLTTTNESISQYTTSLNNQINNTISTEVSELVTDSLNDSLSNSKNKAKINTLLLVPKSNIEKNILQTIDQLPSLDEQQLSNVEVSQTTREQLSKIISAAKKYANEMNHPVSTSGQFSIQYYIQQMKQQLMYEGTILTDEVKISAQEAGDRTFSINAPTGFVTKNIVLTLPNGTDFTVQPGTIELPALPKGKIRVSATFSLVDPSTDILAPVKWSWTLGRHYEETALSNNLITKVSIPTNSVILNDEQQNLETKETTEENQAQQDGNEVDKKEEIVNNKENSIEEETQTTENSKQNTTKSPGKDAKAKIKTKEIEKSSDSSQKEITVTNDTIHHEIETTLATKDDIPNQVAVSIWNYQRLQALFNLYFNIDVTNPDQFAQLSNSTFEKIGSKQPDSLYYALSNKGMKEFIISIIKQTLVDDITSKLAKDMGNINDQVNKYNEELNEIIDRFPTLLQQIDEAIISAQQQNDELDLLLPAAEQWREASNNLVLSGTEMSDINNLSGQVSIDLQDGIGDLLAASSSVADRAEIANSQADSVYDSFDNIYQTAEQVKNGSSMITTKADKLADDLIKKVSNDNDYAMNFRNVLANSKIGNKQNEALYDFLSNPISMEKSSVENVRDTRTTFYLIVIASFLALFTAYVMSSFKQFTFKKTDFENSEEQGLVRSNLPILLFTTAVAIIEGLIVGTLSLTVNKFISVSPVIWIVIITLLMTLLVLFTTYLLRQLKMIGMFLILLIISMYIFFTEALGFDFERSHIIQEFSRWSPLHYLEVSISNVLNNANGSFITIAFMSIATILVFTLNLFVIRFSQKKEEAVYEA